VTRQSHERGVRLHVLIGRASPLSGSGFQGSTATVRKCNRFSTGAGGGPESEETRAAKLTRRSSLIQEKLGVDWSDRFGHAYPGSPRVHSTDELSRKQRSSPVSVAPCQLPPLAGLAPKRVRIAITSKRPRCPQPGHGQERRDNTAWVKQHISLACFLLFLFLFLILHFQYHNVTKHWKFANSRSTYPVTSYNTSIRMHFFTFCRSFSWALSDRECGNDSGDPRPTGKNNRDMLLFKKTTGAVSISIPDPQSCGTGSLLVSSGCHVFLIPSTPVASTTPSSPICGALLRCRQSRRVQVQPPANMVVSKWYQKSKSSQSLNRLFSLVR